MIKRNIGSIIKKYRTSRGMSQAELGKILNVSNRTISSWETNRTEPDPESVDMMVCIFGCKRGDLFGYEKVEVNLDFDELQIIGKWRDADDLTKDMVRRILGVI